MLCEFVEMMVMTLEWYVCCTAVKCAKALVPLDYFRKLALWQVFSTDSFFCKIILRDKYHFDD